MQSPLYLVRLIHAMDDLPVRLFDDLDHAKAFLVNIDMEPTTEIRALFSEDCSTPVRADIVEYVNGVPTRFVDFKEFE